MAAKDANEIVSKGGAKPDTSLGSKDIGNVGTRPNEHQVALAEKLPEKDPVQKATKEAFLADTPKDEVKAKVKIVDESPDAAETPSGYALKKVAGISDDAERGEEYLAHKTARRWGYKYVDEG